MKIITTLERETTFTEIKKALSNGTARELFGGVGSISVEVEEIGTVIFDIIGYDSEKLVDKDSKHSMTLWMRDLLFDEMAFDEEGSNRWENSSLRKHINSEHSLSTLSQDLENYLARFTKETATEQIQKISSSCCQKKNWKTAIMNLLKPSVIA